MYFGYRSLYVLALVLYGLAFASSLYRRSPAKAEAPAAATARTTARAR